MVKRKQLDADTSNIKSTQPPATLKPNKTSTHPYNWAKKTKPKPAVQEEASECVSWTSLVEAELVQFLVEVKHAGSTSQGGFKQKVWNDASAHLQEECKVSIKPSACKNKYGKASLKFYTFVIQ